MGLSQEEADKVFTVLVTECGVDEKTQYVFKGNSDNTYKVWAGSLALDVTLKDNAVDTVMKGKEQVYPEVKEEEKKEEEPEKKTEKQGEERNEKRQGNEKTDKRRNDKAGY